MKSEVNYDKLLSKWEWDSEYIAEELAVEFAQNVFEAIDGNFNKKELAEKMGVSKAHVSQILNGKTNITFKTVAKIASAIRIKVNAPSFKQTTVFSKWSNQIGEENESSIEPSNVLEFNPKGKQQEQWVA